MVLEHGCRLVGHLPSYHVYGKLGCISTHYKLSRDTPACCCEAVPHPGWAVLLSYGDIMQVLQVI